MERAIVGYHQDDVGDWVAHLACGHRQHVRHRPPFQPRPWVLEPEGRSERIGRPLDCPLCDRAELPDGLRFVRTTPIWDETTLPPALRRAHRVAPGTWARIAVTDGRLRFTARTSPPIEAVLGAGSTQPVPPEVEHEVEPLGPVRLSVDFLAVDETATPADRDEGGESACMAHLLCPDCGAVLDGGPHREGCPSAPG